MLLPLQGVTNGCALTQGVASLALGYALVGLSARFGIKFETLITILLCKQQSTQQTNPQAN